MATPDRENSSIDPRFTPSPSGSSVGVQTPFDRQGAWLGSVGLDRPRLTRSGGNRAARPPGPLRPRRSLATLGFRLAVGAAPGPPPGPLAALLGASGPVALPPGPPPGKPLAARPLEPSGTGRSAPLPCTPRLSSLALGWLGRSPLPCPSAFRGAHCRPQEPCPASPGGCSRRPQGPCPRRTQSPLGLSEGPSPRAPRLGPLDPLTGPPGDLTRRSGSPLRRRGRALPSVAGGARGGAAPTPLARDG